ncbi:AAA family ATPase [Homoserinimonas sp. OAct 916]|uniref:helix-turn-helix transcriptional regulator n=1 Tax=Homoserinimonas sp. OAct 916 TaxID=2211450 RepID=UPI000DBE4151|nr:AAA family ATPase [Homoserinimonas sp. OAct 916]
MSVSGPSHRPHHPVGTLYERDRELEALTTLIEEAAGGLGGLGLVEGGLGAGKTRLLAELTERAERAGFRVLCARGREREQATPFGVVRQLFDELAASDDSARLFSGAAGAALSLLDAGSDAAILLSDDGVSVMRGLHSLTVELARTQPLAITIDDLTRCDPSSLRFVTYLAARLEHLAVLLLVAVPDRSNDQDAALVEELARNPGAITVRPTMLSRDAVRDLLRERFGVEPGPGVAHACFLATGGNPLLVTELSRAAHDEGLQADAATPVDFQRVGARAAARIVRARLAQLDPDAAPVARALSVFGSGASITGLSSLTGLTESRVALACHSLIDGELLNPEPPLEFLYPVIGAAVYHDLAPGERELQHARAARVLLDAGEPVSQVAAQLVRVPPRGARWIVDLLRQAAQVAVDRGDSYRAAHWLRRALAEPAAEQHYPGLLLELGTAEALVNDPRAHEHLSVALAAQDDPGSRARVAAVLARTLVTRGSRDRATALIIAAARELPAAPNPEQGAAEDPYLGERRRLAAIGLFAAGPGPVEDDVNRLIDSSRPSDFPPLLGTGTGSGAETGTAMLRAMLAWRGARGAGNAAESSTLALAALTDHRLIRADPSFMLHAASTLILADRPEAGAIWTSALVNPGSANRSPGASIHLWSGWVHLQRGALVDATRALQFAVDEETSFHFHGPEFAEPQTGSGSGRAATAAALLSRALVARGDLTGARAALRRCGPVPDDSDAGILYRVSEMEVLLGERRWPEAAEHAAACGRLVPVETNPAWAPWRSGLARALVPLGRPAEARLLLQAELLSARRWGAPSALARALRQLGSLHPHGFDELQEAVELTAGSIARLEHALSLESWGEALLADSRSAEAKAALRLAYDVANECGAAPLAQRARSQLYAAGGRPHTNANTGVRSLTRSERRVADLAAEGHSNRHIAETLYVTLKTVEVHLSNSYRKLNIHSRFDLAAALNASPRHESQAHDSDRKPGLRTDLNFS